VKHFVYFDDRRLLPPVHTHNVDPVRIISNKLCKCFHVVVIPSLESRHHSPDFLLVRGSAFTVSSVLLRPGKYPPREIYKTEDLPKLVGKQLKGPSYLVGDFPYVGKVDGLVLLVVSVGLLVSGVQAQPTTIIPANEGSSARWRIQLGRAISIFCVRFGRYRK
jgi:hypothetical protein